MIKSIQKIIKVGNSGAVTIPAKEMKRSRIGVGDEVEVIIRPLESTQATEDEAVLTSARSVLREHKKDFKNLADR